MTDQAPSTDGQANQTATDTTKSEPWYSSYDLPEEDIGFIQNKGWEDSPVKAFQAYKELEKYRGVPAEQLLKLPKDMANKEEMAQIYAKLGRPEKPEDYKFEIDGEYDTARVEFFKPVAHELGLNTEQLKTAVVKLREYENGAYEKAMQEKQLQQTSELETLKKEWGQAFEERSELGRRAVRAFLPEGNKEQWMGAMEESIGTAAMLKLFSNIGEKIGEDKIPEAGGERKFGQTPAQVKADIEALKDEVKADKARLDLFNKGTGPDYKKMQALLNIAA